MDVLKYKDYEGSAELDVERGVCHGKLLFINDLVTYVALTPKRLQKEFEAAVDDYIETCRSLAKEPQRPFRGMFNVRVASSLHRAAALRAVADGVTLNDIVVRALDTFVNGKTEIHHNIQLTLERRPSTQTITSVATGKPQWGVTHVH